MTLGNHPDCGSCLVLHLYIDCRLHKATLHQKLILPIHSCMPHLNRSAATPFPLPFPLRSASLHASHRSAGASSPRSSPRTRPGASASPARDRRRKVSKANSNESSPWRAAGAPPWRKVRGNPSIAGTRSEKPEQQRRCSNNCSRAKTHPLSVEVVSKPQFPLEHLPSMVATHPSLPRPFKKWLT